ncbi:MAG TPA: CotH kinase family protein, partial [Bacteroidia bacterium]|nr:CotH kinase family protein [Bacteroidia bacterium]
MRFLKCIVCAYCCLAQVNAQSLYDGGTIQKIEIYFSQSNWDYQLDTARLGFDDYVIADWVKINGSHYDSVGVKYKGNSSYDSTYIKNPLHIELDNVKAQSHQGFTDIKLGNNYADPSGIREVLAYKILNNYMHCPQANFAQLYINSNYIGLFANVESINKDFLSTHFNSSSNTFFKCNPTVTPGPTTKSNLRYIPFADSSGYFNFYELKSDYGWNELVNLCDTVTNYQSNVSNVLDMDRVLWMLAFNQVLVNLDSYTGVFCQNYYLYKDASSRFSPIMWDLNMAFGGFPFIGSGNTSMGSMTVTNLQQLTPIFHATDTYWPLINVVMNNAAYKKEFMAHARTIFSENFSNGNYVTDAAALQLLIDTAVLADANNFFTYTQFQNGLTGDVVFGSYTVPGISNLMNGRINYLQTNADFIKVPPVINAVQPSTNTPALNSLITINATVSNATQVYLGYRSNAQNAFVRTTMFDDGLHNDGAAAD